MKSKNKIYREKGRAVFLAAIMILSVVAMSAAFAGAAAAVEDGGNGITLTDANPDADATNVTIDLQKDGQDEVAAISLDFSDSGVDLSDVTATDVLVELGGTDITAATGLPSADLDNIENLNVVELSDSSIAIVFQDSAEDNVNATFSNGDDIDVTIQDNFDNVQAGQYDTVVGLHDLEGAAGSDVNLNAFSSTTLTYTVQTTGGSTSYFVDGNERTLIYAGQVVEVKNDSAPLVNGADYNLREADGFDTGTVDGSSQVEELVAEINDNGEVVVEIDTDGLGPGDYFITGPNLPTSNNVDQDDSFELTTQSLTVAFDADSVTDSGNDAVTEFEVDSNRGTYDLNVSADGDLDVGELQDIFVNNGPFTLDGTDDDEDRITLSEVTDGDDYEIDFTGIDPGDYEFVFEVDDTDASASDTITVREEDTDGSFSQGVYQTTAGDIAEFTLNLEDTDKTWIQIGDENSGFTDIIYVVDDDETGEVTFQMNTRLAGTDAPTSDVYHSEDDVIEASAVHDFGGDFSNLEARFLDDSDDALSGTGDGDQEADFQAYLEELGLIDSVGDSPLTQLTRPLQSTSYELTASADGIFIADDGESQADDELDSAVLELLTPELGAITTHVAPEDNADEDDELEDLLSVVTERDEITLDDRLILQVEATGLYGAMLNKSDEQWDLFDEGTNAETLGDLIAEGGEGIEFTLEAEETIGNQDPTELNLDSTDKEDILILVDPDGGQFFIIVDTSEDNAWSSGTPSDGDTFTATLEYETDDDDRYRFNLDAQGAVQGAFDGGANGDAAYPYFRPGTDAEISASFDFEEASVSFNNLNADDEIEAEQSDAAEIAGTTNIAPGSAGEIRVASTDASTSFRMGEQIDINEDGTFSITFDFSSQEVGDEFDTRFRASGSNIDTVDSVIVEALGVDEPVDDEETDQDATEDDEVTDDDADDVVDDDDSDEPVDDETPGFGVFVALVALLGAALLAARRQN